MLLTVELHNCGPHKELKLDLNKQSVIVLGDSATGKSYLSRIILAHLGVEAYPNNPLPDGEAEGWSRTTKMAKSGKVFETSRKYARQEDGTVKLQKFIVKGPNGRSKSLEEVMEDEFDGIFTNKRFDYIGYFYQTKGPVSQWNYFVKAIGGDTIEKNKAEIKQLEKDRGALDNPRSVQEALWKKVDPGTDDLREQYTEYFAGEMKPADATTAKEDHLKKKLPMEAHQAKLEAHTTALTLVSQNAKAIASYKDEIIDIEQQIMDLQTKLMDKKDQLKSCEAIKATQNKDVLTDAQLTKLTKQIQKDEKHNNQVEADATKLYDEKLEEIMEFNRMKSMWIDGVKAKGEYETLNNQWNDLDAQVKSKKKENDETFKTLLPLPELTIGGTDDEPTILYKGRPFDRDNLSTGEQIEITAAIQAHLNPDQDNFIVIPNAGDLGSKLKEVQAILEKFNIQYLVEMTKPDEEFHVEVIEKV